MLCCGSRNCILRRSPTGDEFPMSDSMSNSMSDSLSNYLDFVVFSSESPKNTFAIFSVLNVNSSKILSLHPPARPLRSFFMIRCNLYFFVVICNLMSQLGNPPRPERQNWETFGVNKFAGEIALKR